jgi:WD40 repeat protein
VGERVSRRAFLVGAGGAAAAAAVAAAGCDVWRRRLPIIEGARLSREAGIIRSLAFTRDGRYAVSGGADAVVRVWDLRRRAVARAFAAPGRIGRLALHAGGALLAVSGFAARQDGGHFVALIDLATGRVVREIERLPYGSIDGVWFAGADRLVTSYSDRAWPENSKLWEVGSGRLLRTFNRYVADVAADGRTALAGPSIWDLDSARVKADCPVRSRSIVWGVKIARSGTRAVSQRDGAFLWDARGALLRRFDDQRRWIWGADFSPDDRLLLTASSRSDLGSTRNVLVLRDGRSGAPRAECVGHRSHVLAVGFAPDGRLALSADRDGGLFLWPMPAA